MEQIGCFVSGGAFWEARLSENYNKARSHSWLLLLARMGRWKEVFPFWSHHHMESLTLPKQPWGEVSEQSLTESLTLHVFQLHKNPFWPLLEVTSWLYYLGNNEELSLAAEPGVLCPCFSTKGQLLRPTDACQPARNLILDPGVQLTCNTSMLRIVWFLSEVLLCLEGRKSSWEQRGREPGTFLSTLAFFFFFFRTQSSFPVCPLRGRCLPCPACLARHSTCGVWLKQASLISVYSWPPEAFCVGLKCEL